MIDSYLFSIFAPSTLVLLILLTASLSIKNSLRKRSPIHFFTFGIPLYKVQRPHTLVEPLSTEVVDFLVDREDENGGVSKIKAKLVSETEMGILQKSPGFISGRIALDYAKELSSLTLYAEFPGILYSLLIYKLLLHYFPLSQSMFSYGPILLWTGAIVYNQFRDFKELTQAYSDVNDYLNHRSETI